MKRSSRGFTLVELLVVVGIIAVLIGILFPALRRARESAMRTQCASNIRQIGMAMFMYANENKGNICPIQPATNPPTGANSLYAWDKATVVEPLMRYGLTLELMACPSNPNLFTPVALSTIPAHADDYMSNIAYIAGLGDPRIITRNAPFGAVWYDDPPSASTLQIQKKADKIILADLNVFFQSDNGLMPDYTGPNKNWLFSNHLTNNRLDLSVGVINNTLRGSNRMYSDGHVEWITPERMGKNNTTITTDPTSGRYSHYQSQRPYFW